MSDEAAKKIVEAVRAGDKAALDTLLTSEPGLLEFRAPNGSSVLLLSAYYGHGELAEVFRRHGAMPDVFEASALGDLEAVREVVGGDRGLVNAFAADGFYPLGLAGFFGDPGIGEFLPKNVAGVKPSARKCTKGTPIPA